MVRGATPDVVLTGVELLARGLDPEQPGAGDVVVVDVGGATTDVHSVVELDPEDGSVDASAGPRGGRHHAGHPHRRGRPGHALVRGRPPWPRPGSVDLDGAGRAPPARTRRTSPTATPRRDADEAIARAAVGLALRRHAGRTRVVVSPEGRVVERTGKDLREVDLLVGSGGVLRNGRPGVADRVLAGSIGAASRAAGSCPSEPGSSSTATTCSPPPACWPAPHPDAAYRLVVRVLDQVAG